MRWQLRGLWKNPDFMKVWLSRTISNLGNGITGIALPVIAVQVLAATPAQMSILSALNGMAVLLFGLLAGVWIDRLRRRPVLIATELVEGNSKLGMSDALAEVGGPAVAGIVIQAISVPLSMFVDALSFLASAFYLARIRKLEPRPLPAKQRRSAWHESIEGIRFVLKNPLLRTLAGSAGVCNFFGTFVGTFYAFYVIRELHVSPIILGLLIAAGGLSALIGAWLAERIVRRLGLGLTIGGGLFAYGLIGLPIPLAHGPVSVIVTLLFASQLVGDVAVSIHLITELSLRQMLIPHYLAGRDNTAIQFLTLGVAPFGALLAGIIAEQFGVRFTLFTGICGVIVAGLWLLLSPVRRIQALESGAGL